MSLVLTAHTLCFPHNVCPEVYHAVTDAVAIVCVRTPRLVLLISLPQSTSLQARVALGHLTHSSVFLDVASPLEITTCKVTLQDCRELSKLLFCLLVQSTKMFF
jgi:hypothetical protein